MSLSIIVHIHNNSLQFLQLIRISILVVIGVLGNIQENVYRDTNTLTPPKPSTPHLTTKDYTSENEFYILMLLLILIFFRFQINNATEC